MELREEARFSHPLERVFVALRDCLPQLVPHLPSVESIETVERSALGDGRERLVNLWQANRLAAPPIARPFLTASLLRWRDVAEWDEKARVTDWRFETSHFERLYDCQGRNFYHELGPERCRLELTGQLLVYPERVPGLPRLLASRVRTAIEGIIAERVRSNLAQLAAGLERWLAGG